MLEKEQKVIKKCKKIGKGRSQASWKKSKKC